MMTNTEKLAKLFEILNEAKAYRRSIGKLEFDIQCCAPADGMEQAGDDMAVLGKKLFELTHSEEYAKLLTELNENGEGLSDVQKRAVKCLFDSYEKTKNISPELSFEIESAVNKAYGKWLSAKEAKDFNLFKDSLADIVKYTRKTVELQDKDYGSYYNACLDDYEKGGNEQQLDGFFTALKARIVPLLDRIVREGKFIRNDFLTRKCEIPKQEKFSRYLLELQGMKMSATVLMATEHPFTTNFGPHDVRVTTHYFEDNFISNIFSTLHEGGHALFMQNEPEEFYKNHNSDNMSNAMHECISRFYENIIGRSPEFISFVYPKLMEIMGDDFKDVSETELYEAVNIAKPGLIRTEADELSYSLHVLIRYEIEKALVNGEITVDNVPELWNAKYKEYLGVDVPDDSQGCLQDVHWTSGFGYFPSYALGNAYGAQILVAMEKDFDVFTEVKKGNLTAILNWLKEHVFSIASMLDPDEWIKEITGESLNPDYYLDYLEKKYTTIYGLD